MKSNSVSESVISIQFVDNDDVSEVFRDHREVQIDDYDTDSDDEETEKSLSMQCKIACITRSGRAVRSFVRLDL